MGKTTKDPRVQKRIEEVFGEKEALPPREVTIVPSGSKTDLFLTCAWPWGRKIAVTGDGDPGEPARFGSAFHEVLAHDLDLLVEFPPKRQQIKIKASGGFTDAVARRFGVGADRVRERVSDALPILFAWLRNGNPYGVDFTADMHLEESYAIVLNSSMLLSRSINNPTPDGHVYEDARPNELPLTIDLFANARDKDGRHILLILDHKSGYELMDVSASGQLKTGACAIWQREADTRVVVGFFHAPAGGAPEVYALEVSPEELHAHLLALRDRHLEAKKEPRSLTPSSLCARCPAFSICPTNTTGLMELRGGVGKLALTTPEAVGRAHQTLKDYESRFGAMARVIDQEIRDAVKGPIGFGVRPDGYEVAFVDRPYTNLSLASIERALGKIEAKKVVAYLDKKGVIERGTRAELRAVPPSGSRGR